MTQYVVQPGDCLSSIAHQFGFTWQLLWKEPSNADLRALRKNPNILFPGDVVHIPEVHQRPFPVALNQWNHFVVELEKAFVQVRLQLNGKALAQVPYAIEVDGSPSLGVTDSEGRVRVPISPSAKTALLRVGDGLVYRLQLGGLDPIETPTGQQARLAQLGYYAGAIDGIFGSLSRVALQTFQASVGLVATEAPNAATLSALRDRFGC